MPRRHQYTEVVSYSQAHLRLKTDRGRPDSMACTKCGDIAREWAYTGGDAAELVSDEGQRYSTDQSRYEPMCTVCHRRHDRAQADGRSTDVCPSGHLWLIEGSLRKKRSRTTGLRFCRACNREHTRRWRAQRFAQSA